MFLKVKATGPKGDRKRLEDLARASSIVKMLKVPKHEPLEAVLARLGVKPMTPKLWALNSQIQAPPETEFNLDWTSSRRAQKEMGHCKVEPKDLFASEDLKYFWVASAALLNVKCRRQAQIRLASLKKRGKLPDWRKVILVLNADESASRLGCGVHNFPCVQPKRKHILALRGSLSQADGRACLAMQGFQAKELQAFPSISEESSVRKQDWAGNAFCANTTAAYILALAVVR